MKVLRIYHGGRDTAHRERDRALTRAGVEVMLVIPTSWPGGTACVSPEAFEIVELPTKRQGDVNRHRFIDPGAINELVRRFRPDVVDLHEEPVSSVVHQVLTRLPQQQPVVLYSAQNIDKRFPPPFAQRERAALGRAQGIYPCTRQAASVVVGKGFCGAVEVLPLAPPREITLGRQARQYADIRMLLVGRLVEHKGVLDAVRLLSRVSAQHPACLVVVGSGPAAAAARELARSLDVEDSLHIKPWMGPAELADEYRNAHIVLAPSRTTRTWVEQFGRMVVEAHAAGAVVVGYASGSLPEVVGSAGVLVPEGDLTALTNAVIELRDHPQRWLELRNAGRLLARSRTWDAVANGQLELYSAAAENAGRRPASRPKRAIAATEYGAPADVSGVRRPFALPLLRQNTTVNRWLGRAIDAAARSDAAPPPPRLKVVYIDHVARLSGGELALGRLISALPQIDAHVILGEDGPLREVLLAAGATVEILPMDTNLRDTRRTEVGAGLSTVRSVTTSLSYSIRLARRLRALQPDLVHTNSLKSGFLGAVSARLAGLPVIWHVRDRIADDYLPQRVVRFTRLALRYLPDFVVCNSAETMRTSGVEQHRSVVGFLVPLHSAGVRVIAGLIGGVINDSYQNAPRVTAGHEGLCIGMVGRLSPWKGQDVFLRAFAAAFAHQPAVRGKIIGSAMFGEEAYEQSLRELVRELGLENQITMCGFAADVPAELQKLDILVHASVVAEPFGQVVLEGMAAGLPVIATAAGGPAEIITDDVDGLLTAPGDVAELADCLRRLAADLPLRQRLGAAATRRAADFGPAIIGEHWRALYREVVASKAQ